MSVLTTNRLRAALSIVLGMVALASIISPGRAQTAAGGILASRIEVIPISTMTLTDEEFLTGSKDGKPTTIAGVLRVPRVGSDRLPAIVLVHASGGIGGNVDNWEQQLNAIGVATFTIDSFTARGITSTVADQTQLSRLTAIVDVYRALDVLASRPWIDPNRIALMGFSRGAQVALYASLTRFQKMYEHDGHNFAAYIGFYTPCNTRFIGDEEVGYKPIRLFHGTPDDYVPVAPCRAYVERLRKAGKDVQLTEYPGAWHVFDNPLSPETIFLANAQTTRNCTIQEESPGRLVNTKTMQPFTYSDPCVEVGAHIGYNAAATTASLQAVKDFLRSTFALKN